MNTHAAPARGLEQGGTWPGCMLKHLPGDSWPAGPCFFEGGLAGARVRAGVRCQSACTLTGALRRAGRGRAGRGARAARGRALRAGRAAPGAGRWRGGRGGRVRARARARAPGRARQPGAAAGAPPARAPPLAPRTPTACRCLLRSALPPGRTHPCAAQSSSACARSRAARTALIGTLLLHIHSSNPCTRAKCSPACASSRAGQSRR